MTEMTKQQVRIPQDYIDAQGLSISAGVYDFDSQEVVDYELYKEQVSWDEKTLENVLEEVRIERNKSLLDSDIFMIEDYPLSTLGKTKDQVLAYRQSLRDFPSTIIEKPLSWEDITFPVL